jgi:drug/metabolite transporter (DMT)-like permease
VNSTARPLDTAAIVLVVLLCLTWGFNQVATKLAMPDIPPLIQAAIRSAGGTVMVIAWALWRREPLLQRDGTLVPGLVTGVLFGLEFLCIFRGLVWTTAVRAVLFIYLTPFFVVIGARWFLPGDRFDVSQWLGLLLSFAGMVIAFGLPTPSADPSQIIGDIMMVIAAILWASTTLVMKGSRLQQAPFAKTLLYQLVISIPILVAGALAFGERLAPHVSALAIGSVIYQTIWVAGVTFLAWFSLVQRYSASRLSAFTFLTPLFGVVGGHLVLGEPLSIGFGIAVLFVAGGLVLVNRPRPAAR